MPSETQKVVSMYNQGIVSMCEEVNELTQSWLYICIMYISPDICMCGGAIQKCPC